MSGFRAPKLGIGMIYAPALRPFLQRRAGVLDVLEIEPQTLWLADDGISGPFREFGPAIDLFADRPETKLVHSVGMPLGGTRPPDPGQMALIRDTARRLDSPWVSEHLSVGGTPHIASGFFLPPLQTGATAELAAANVRASRTGVERPVAVETGVAYLARKSFEMSDGAFVAEVAERADCGILLDLHNIYCNELNGRCRMDDFLRDLPLDRVWEIHLAGGAEMDGFWLDSHSGEMPEDLAARSLEIVQSLPNLGVINFEIYDTFLEQLDIAAFDRITSGLRRIWEAAGKSTSDAPPFALSGARANPGTSAGEWEGGLTRAVWKSDPAFHPFPEDHAAVTLYAKLARSFRGSMITRALPRLIRYLLLRDGEQVQTRLSDFFGDVPPRLFTPLEAQAFSDWLREGGETDPLALALMDYDLAFIRIVETGDAQVVSFPGNPAPVFESLAQVQLPNLPDPPVWELEILPDSFTPDAFQARDGAS